MRYAVLLRGINVGGHHKVPMADLRETLSGLGYTGVGTHLQSGNAVFTAPERPAREYAALIAEAVRERFGFAVDCLALSAAELRAAAARCPFDPDSLDQSKLLVVFLDRPPGGHPAASMDPDGYAPDELRLGEREIFAYFPGGLGRSKLGQRLSAPWPDGVATARNWRTVAKLLELTAD